MTGVLGLRVIIRQIPARLVVIYYEPDYREPIQTRIPMEDREIERPIDRRGKEGVERKKR